MVDMSQSIHEVYMDAQKVFEPSRDLLKQTKNIKDEEELRFYRVMTDFFIQQKQKEVIND